jgi:hypothetical protein
VSHPMRPTSAGHAPWQQQLDLGELFPVGIWSRAPWLAGRWRARAVIFRWLWRTVGPEAGREGEQRRHGCFFSVKCVCGADCSIGMIQRLIKGV